MVLIFTILIGIIVLGLLVFVHEAAHFLTAKFFNVRVDEFGFGFPPRIWGKKKGETVYSINAIPAGGFVRLHGEDGEDKKDPRSFAAKNPWQRSAIIVAGVVMNLLVAFVLFTVFIASNDFRTDTPVTIPTSGQTLEINFPFGDRSDSAMIEYILADSPAHEAGLQGLDTIASINGQKVSSIQQVQEIVRNSNGQELTFQIYNILDRAHRTVSVAPTLNQENQYSIGVSLSKVVTIRYESLGEKIFVGPLHSANTLVYQGTVFGALISRSFEEGTAEPVASTVSGPVGIVALIGSFIGVVGARGTWVLVETVALISLLLALINVLPIPAVDGGRLFFALFEGFTGKKVNQNVERLIHTAGFAVLILLFLLITFNDIAKIIN